VGNSTSWAKIKCTGGQVPIDETDTKSKCKLPEGSGGGVGEVCSVDEYAQCDDETQCKRLHLSLNDGNGLCAQSGSNGCFGYDDANTPACDINDRYRCNEVTKTADVASISFSSGECLANLKPNKGQAECEDITGTALGSNYAGSWEEFGTCDYEAERPSTLADNVPATAANTCNVLIDGGNTTTFLPTEATCTWTNITAVGANDAQCTAADKGTTWATTEVSCSKTNGYANLAACTALHDVGTGGGYVPSEATCTWTDLTATTANDAQCTTDNMTGATWTTTKVDCTKDDASFAQNSDCSGVLNAGTPTLSGTTCTWTGITPAQCNAISGATPTPTEGKCVKAEVTVAAGKTAAEACAAEFTSAGAADNAVYSKGTCTWKGIAVAADETATEACTFGTGSNAVATTPTATKGKCFGTAPVATTNGTTQTAAAACAAEYTTASPVANTAIYSKGNCHWTSTTEDTCTDLDATGPDWNTSNTEKCVIKFN